MIVKNGIFSVLLGQVNPIDPSVVPFDIPYCLEIIVGGEIISPRREIVSVGYSFRSKHSDKLDGKDASDFATAGHNHDDSYYTENELNASDGNPPNQGSNRMSWNNLKDVPDGFVDGIDNTGGGDDTAKFAYNADSLGGKHTTQYVDFSSSQIISGAKMFNNPTNSFTGNGANLTSLNASNISAGSLSTDRFSAYSDLSAEGKIGSSSGQVAAGDHAHSGVYASYLHGSFNHSGTIGSYGQISGTHDNSAHNPQMVDLLSEQTMTGLKRFENFGSTYKGSLAWLKSPPASAIVATEGITNGNVLYAINNSNFYPTLWARNDRANDGTNAIYAENSNCANYPTIYAKNNCGEWAIWVQGNLGASGTKSSVINTSVGEATLYSLEGTDVEFYCCGSVALMNGSASVFFERIFTDAISPDIPVKIIVTPTSECNGMYVATKTSNGFTVRELLSGTSNASFDWIAIGRRKGYEARPVFVAPKGGNGGKAIEEIK